MQALFVKCPALIDLFQAPNLVGRSGSVIHWHTMAASTANNLLLLDALMEKFRPKSTLEIGLAAGASAMLLCQCHKSLGRAGQKQHIAIDPFQTTVTDWDSAGLMAMERAGLADYLDFHEGPSAFELPKLHARGQRFGLIYVDGSHLFENVFVDAYFGTRLLEPDGIVAFDDCSNSHVATVIRFLRSNCPGLREINLNNYRTHPRHPLFYESARRLGRLQMVAFQKIGGMDRPWDSELKPF